MKKSVFIKALFAFVLVVLVGTHTAEANSRYAYYPVATNYYDTYRSCTPRNSDLGLGGGVFVSGTIVCPTVQNTSSRTQTYYNSDDRSDYSDYDQDDSEYYENDSYDNDDSEYDDSDYDESDDNDDDYNDSGSNNNGGNNGGNNSW